MRTMCKNIILAIVIALFLTSCAKNNIGSYTIISKSALRGLEFDSSKKLIGEDCRN